MNSQPTISIILLTFNGGRRFAQALDKIFSQRYAGAPPEVILIDSGSQDETLATASRFPVTVHAIHSEAFGHGPTRNLGARLARGDWLVFLSQDAVPASQDWLHLLTRHLADPAIAAAFGRQLAPPGVGPIEAFFLSYTYPDRAFQHMPDAGKRESIRRVFFSNVNSAIKRSVWQRFPFPEVIMSEDQAFARAALRAGYAIVYDPEASVYHGHRYTLDQLFRRNFDSGYSLREIVSDGWQDISRMGLNYVASELRYLIRGGHWPDIPYALLYELVKSAGFALGRLGHRMPLSLRRRMSLHPQYWSHVSE